MAWRAAKRQNHIEEGNSSTGGVSKRIEG